MFKNPGRKLKGIAKVVFALLLIVYVILAVAIMLGVMPVGDSGTLDGAAAIVTGIVLILVGLLIAWLSSIAIYAAGAAVDDLQTIKKIQLELYNKKTGEQ